MIGANIGWDDKCACLYNDPLEVWSFNGHQEAFTADYIVSSFVCFTCDYEII